MFKLFEIQGTCSDKYLAAGLIFVLIMIKSGTIVRLKSGGPLMTVKEYVHVLGMWVCSWFDQNGALCESAFMEEQLIVETE